jgi:hypothetical protein
LEKKKSLQRIRLLLFVPRRYPERIEGSQYFAGPSATYNFRCTTQGTYKSIQPSTIMACMTLREKLKVVTSTDSVHPSRKEDDSEP